MLQQKTTSIISDYFFLGNNPELPNYPHPDYLDIVAELSEIYDLYTGDRLWIKDGKISDFKKAKRYLTPNPAETNEIYLHRLLRARYKPIFKTVIDREYLGLLSQFSLSGFTDPEEYLDNIDFRGNSVKAFFKECDRLALRDGSCFVFVDIPNNSDRIVTEYIRQQSQIRPYFVILERCNVIGWSTEIINGTEVLTSVTIIEQTLESKGKFGKEYKLTYRIITPNDYAVFSIANGEANVTDYKETRLGYIPLIPYSLTSTNGFTADFPLKGLADINKDWYQLNSELREMINNTQPTLNLKEEATIVNDENVANRRVKIGSHAVLWNVEGKWIEASGTGIKPTQEQIDKLEKEADELSIGFLSGSLVPRTATESDLDAKQAEGNLTSLVLQKQSAINNCFDYYYRYYNKDNPVEISFTNNLLKPVKTWDIKDVMDSVNSGFISRGFGMKLLKFSGAFPENIDDEMIENELSLTGESLATINDNPIVFEES